MTDLKTNQQYGAVDRDCKRFVCKPQESIKVLITYFTCMMYILYTKHIYKINVKVGTIIYNAKSYLKL